MKTVYSSSSLAKQVSEKLGLNEKMIRNMQENATEKDRLQAVTQ